MIPRPVRPSRPDRPTTRRHRTAVGACVAAGFVAPVDTGPRGIVTPARPASVVVVVRSASPWGRRRCDRTAAPRDPCSADAGDCSPGRDADPPARVQAGTPTARAAEDASRGSGQGGLGMAASRSGRTASANSSRDDRWASRSIPPGWAVIDSTWLPNSSW